jgi:peroxiredoxin Q/BCP
VKKRGDKLNLDFEVAVPIEGKKTPARFGDFVVGPTIVSVYMRNNTSSCDKQMISLAEASESIRAKGFNIIGLSKDTVGSHLKYAAKHGIDFTLVSDPNHLFAKATDSLIEKKMYGKTFWGPSRSAYALGADGVLLGTLEKVDSAAHGEQVLDWLASL